MGLHPIRPGLHRLKNDSIQPAKVQLVIPPGDELEVSDDVAEQLHAASTHFKDPATVPVPPPQAAKDADGVVIVDEPVDELPAEAAVKKPAAKKTPVKKAAAAKKTPVKKAAAAKKDD